MNLSGIARIEEAGLDGPGGSSTCNVVQPRTVAETGLSEPLLIDLL
jgi:hypothetical protein